MSFIVTGLQLCSQLWEILLWHTGAWKLFFNQNTISCSFSLKIFTIFFVKITPVWRFVAETFMKTYFKVMSDYFADYNSMK